MSDAEIRALERAVELGDEGARARLNAARLRTTADRLQLSPEDLRAILDGAEKAGMGIVFSPALTDHVMFMAKEQAFYLPAAWEAAIRAVKESPR